MTDGHENLIVARAGAAGRITLDRAPKMNALTARMVRGMADTLAVWAADPSLRFVVIDGAGKTGLCAGGDIREVYESSLRADGAAPRFWAEEYRLNATIATYPKPIVAFMRGTVMGGGVGISAHASHRIVTDSTRLAMPEVRIGFIPDVGGTWLLARAPGEAGTYLALTGERIGAGDAIALGLAASTAAAGTEEDLPISHSGLGIHGSAATIWRSPGYKQPVGARRISGKLSRRQR